MNVLWLVFFGRRNVRPKAKKLMKNIKNIEDIMKDIWKEYEDEDGPKGRGYVQEISRLMKNFKDRW
jgi:hypothetical protein